MEIIKTHFGLQVPNASSTLIKIHELNGDIFVMETSNGYLQLITSLRADEYMNNLMVYLGK